MIEVSNTSQVPALALPTLATILVNGEPLTVKIVNARRSGQMWAFETADTFMDVHGHTFHSGSVRPVARFDYMDMVTMFTVEGVI